MTELLEDQDYWYRWYPLDKEINLWFRSRGILRGSTLGSRRIWLVPPHSAVGACKVICQLRGLLLSLTIS